jgi:hypothetical protein
MFAEIKLAIYAFTAGCLAYFGIPAEAYGLLALLIVLDTLTGSLKAIVLSPRSFTSADLRNGVLAKLLLLLIPLVVAIVSKSVPQPFDAMVLSSVAGSIGILAVSEAYSILSNVGAIVSKKGGSEMDGVSFVISKLLSIFKAMLDALSKR